MILVLYKDESSSYSCSTSTQLNADHAHTCRYTVQYAHNEQNQASRLLLACTPFGSRATQEAYTYMYMTCNEILVIHGYKYRY